jgi:hypothetical protein
MTIKITTAARASNLIHGIAAGLIAEDPSRCRWLVPANACDAVYLSLLSAGAHFQVVDISAETFSMDVYVAAERLQQDPAIAGILYVHGYGASQHARQDLAELRRLAGPAAIILDDRCLCPPELEPDDAVADLVDGILFSTGNGKVVDLGGGGYGFLREDLAVLAPSDHFDPAAEARVLALLNSYEGEGPHAELQNLLSTWLDPQPGPSWAQCRDQILGQLAPTLDHKNHINDIYRNEIPGELALPSSHHIWRYNMQIPEPDQLIRAIFDAGLFASRHFRPYRANHDAASCPVAAELQGSILNLFNDRRFSIDQAKAVSKIVAGHLSTQGRDLTSTCNTRF